jgi:hypothetical protein
LQLSPATVQPGKALRRYLWCVATSVMI